MSCWKSQIVCKGLVLETIYQEPRFFETEKNLLKEFLNPMYSKAFVFGFSFIKTCRNRTTNKWDVGVRNSGILCLWKQWISEWTVSEIKRVLTKGSYSYLTYLIFGNLPESSSQWPVWLSNRNWCLFSLLCHKFKKRSCSNFTPI